MYEVNAFEITENAQPRWKRVGKWPKKVMAVSAADKQEFRAVVNMVYDSKVLHDNGKPHGGSRRISPNCPCPLCNG
jgi:hypothetical protein